MPTWVFSIIATSLALATAALLITIAQGDTAWMYADLAFCEALAITATALSATLLQRTH